MMKTIIKLLLGLLMFTSSAYAQEADQTEDKIYYVEGIYYSITSENPREVAVVCGDREIVIDYWGELSPEDIIYLNTWEHWSGNSYKGDIIIPETVTIPDLENDKFIVTSIDQGAFVNCEELKSISIPNTINRIGNGAFSHCTQLCELILPNTITEIGEGAFCSCYGMKTLHYSLGCEYIPIGCFSGCGAGNNEFVINGLENVKKIENDALFGLYIKTFPYMPSLEKIETRGVEFTRLRTIDLSYIENDADLYSTDSFLNNKLLTDVILSQNIPDEIDLAFYKCAAISSIKIFNTVPPTLSGNWAAQVAPGCILYVPDESVDAYRKAPYWQNFVIKGHSASIEDTVFEDIKIETGKGRLNVDAPFSVKVFDTSGQLKAEGKQLSLSLPSGIYILSVKGCTNKVMIK